MKLSISITERGAAPGVVASAIRIAQGETLEEPMAFRNSDGTPRNLAGATIAVRTYRRDTATSVAGGPAYVQGSPPLLALSAAASQALTPGPYVVLIEETRGAVVSSGALELVIGRW